MAQYGDELLAQLRVLALVQQTGVARVHALGRIQMEGNELGEQLEHADHLGRIQTRGAWIDRARVPKNVPLGRTTGIEM